MSEKLRSIVTNPNIPMMTDEGISSLLDYISNCKGDFGNEKGPSRRMRLSTSKPFKREKDLTTEEKEKIFKEVFKQIVELMEEDFRKYPNFVELLQSKDKEFKKFKEKDFIDVINLVKGGRIDDAIITELGQYIWKQNSHIVDTEYTTDFERKLPFITKPQRSSTNDFRIYINTSNGKNAAEFLQEYATRCAKRRIPYKMKGLYHKDESRADGTILYVNKDHLEDVINILEGIKEDRPDIIETFGWPLSSAHNEGYYSLSLNPKGQKYTYNDIADLLSALAFVKVISNRILIKYGKSLTVEQKTELELLSKDETDFTSSFDYRIYRPTVIKRIQNLFKLYPDQIASIVNTDKETLIPLMREKLTRCSSIAYYGDVKHLGNAICFPREIYEMLHIDTMEMDKKGKVNSPTKEERTIEKVKPSVPEKTNMEVARKQRAKFVSENVDDTFIIVLNEYLSKCDASPVEATETLFSKLSQLKAEYTKVAQAENLTDTPKYEYMMSMFRVFESFPRFTDDPSKGSGVNFVNKRKHYLSLMPMIKGRATTFKGALTNFDQIEDKELANNEQISARESEVENRRNLVENIVDIIMEMFEEFNNNFLSDPAKSTEVLLTKLSQLKREYMVASALVSGTRTTKKYGLIMKAFERFEANQLYKGESAGKQQYYESVAWKVKQDVQIVGQKIENLDVMD